MGRVALERDGVGKMGVAETGVGVMEPPLPSWEGGLGALRLDDTTPTSATPRPSRLVLGLVVSLERLVSEEELPPLRDATGLVLLPSTPEGRLA